MFSLADAEDLRESLHLIDADSTFHASQRQASQTHSQLQQSYRDFYSLDFSTAENTVEHRMFAVESGGFKLVLQKFCRQDSSAKGSVFLFHGYFDHTGLYGHLIRHCLQLGYDVIIFDLPGHGLSSGAAASVTSFRQYSQALVDCCDAASKLSVPKPWFAIGQSTGSAILIDALQDGVLQDEIVHDGVEFERIVLLAPLVQPSKWGWGKILYSLSKWLPPVRRTFSDNSHDQQFLSFLKSEDPLQARRLSREWATAMVEYMQRFEQAQVLQNQLTIIQGSGDETVAWEYNLRQLAQKFPNSTQVIIADAKHHLVNESVVYRQQVFSEIDKALY